MKSTIQIHIAKETFLPEEVWHMKPPGACFLECYWKEYQEYSEHVLSWIYCKSILRRVFVKTQNFDVSLQWYAEICPESK